MFKKLSDKYDSCLCEWKKTKMHNFYHKNDKTFILNCIYKEKSNFRGKKGNIRGYCNKK